MTFIKTQNKIKGNCIYGALIVLLFAFISTFAVPSTIATDKTSELSPPAPQVLGAMAPVRGEEPVPAPKPIPNLVGTLDLSSIKSAHYLVYDSETGKTLAEKSADSPVAIASLTKLMTALVTYEQSDLNHTVTIPPISSAVVRPVLSLRPGNQVKILDLFNAMLIGSANDAAYVLGVTIPGPHGENFVQAMNEKAAELGMNNTHYSNPLGYDSDFNYSTARDLQALVQALDSYTAFKVLGKKTSYSFSDENGVNYSINATNKLVRSHADVYAIKTGYTDSAQGAMVTKIVRDGHTIVCIILESPARETDTLTLADKIFEAYQWQ